MNPFQEKVREFHRKFGMRAPSSPTLEDYPFALRAKLIAEEAEEFIQACEAKDQVEMIDALCDLIYVACGGANEMGIDLEPFFDEVHRTNMSKLGPDGEPIRREDGKITKPFGWTPPDIEGVLARVIAQRNSG